MTDIVWQDPPTRGGPPPKFLAEATALREHPKRWALLSTCGSAQGAANVCRQGRIGKRAAFRPAEHWEWRSSGCDVYVRYLGEDGAA